MVDATDSKSVIRKGVGVRIPPPAPFVSKHLRGTPKLRDSTSLALLAPFFASASIQPLPLLDELPKAALLL